MADHNTVFRFNLAIIGLILSIYSLHVDIQLLEDKNFKALCDISEHISCSKVFQSKYGHGFGFGEKILGKDSITDLPNPVYGIGFYGTIILLCLFRYNVKAAALLTFLSTLSCVMSIYLAGILYLLSDICVVCIATYVVNFLLMYLNFKRYNDLTVVEKYKAE